MVLNMEGRLWPAGKPLKPEQSRLPDPMPGWRRREGRRETERKEEDGRLSSGRIIVDDKTYTYTFHGSNFILERGLDGGAEMQSCTSNNHTPASSDTTSLM